MLKNPFPSKAYCLKYSTRNCFTDISEGLKLTWCPPLPCKKKKKIMKIKKEPFKEFQITENSEIISIPILKYHFTVSFSFQIRVVK